jgi:hypothetical protein
VEHLVEAPLCKDLQETNDAPFLSTLSGTKSKIYLSYLASILFILLTVTKQEAK